MLKKLPMILNGGSSGEASIVKMARIVIKLISENGGLELEALLYCSREIWKVPDIAETQSALR